MCRCVCHWLVTDGIFLTTARKNLPFCHARETPALELVAKKFWGYLSFLFRSSICSSFGLDMYQTYVRIKDRRSIVGPRQENNQNIPINGPFLGNHNKSITEGGISVTILGFLFDVPSVLLCLVLLCYSEKCKVLVFL